MKDIINKCRHSGNRIATAVCQKAEETNANKALGKHMEEKAT